MQSTFLLAVAISRSKSEFLVCFASSATFDNQGNFDCTALKSNRKFIVRQLTWAYFLPSQSRSIAKGNYLCFFAASRMNNSHGKIVTIRIVFFLTRRKNFSARAGDNCNYPEIYPTCPVGNQIFKVNNKDTGTMPMAQFWYLYC